MRQRPFERAIWGLVSEVIHSVEQPALAKEAVRVQIVQQQCKIALTYFALSLGPDGTRLTQG